MDETLSMTVARGDVVRDFASNPDLYVGTFQNAHGGFWVFTYDRRVRLAHLYHSSGGWDQPLLVQRGGVSLPMSQAEKAWLAACWDACGAIRHEPTIRFSGWGEVYHVLKFWQAWLWFAIAGFLLMIFLILIYPDGPPPGASWYGEAFLVAGWLGFIFGGLALYFLLLATPLPRARWQLIAMGLSPFLAVLGVIALERMRLYRLSHMPIVAVVAIAMLLYQNYFRIVARFLRDPSTHVVLGVMLAQAAAVLALLLIERMVAGDVVVHDQDAFRSTAVALAGFQASILVVLSFAVARMQRRLRELIRSGQLGYDATDFAPTGPS